MKKDLYLICVVGIENPRLPFFLHYYKILGFTKFYIISNRKPKKQYYEIVKDENISVVLKEDDYKNHPDWVNGVLKESLPNGNWCLIADIDELLVFPEYEKKSIEGYVNYLEKNNFDCISTILLDTYSNKEISQTVLDYKISPLVFLNYFDTDTNELRNTKYFGGVRKRIFDVTPLITKYPLFKKQAETIFHRGSHSTSAKNIFYHNSALLHIKYDSTFHKKVIEAVKAKNYWNNSVEYVGYLKILEQNRDLNLWYEGSKKYVNFQSLVDEKVITNQNYQLVDADEKEVSVIICTYGREKISDELVKSLEEQTYKNFKVIIINNNAYSLQQIKNTFLDIKVLNENRIGLSVARNTGIYNSNSPYIMFIDDDVVLKQECIQNLLNGLKNKNSDLAGGKVILPTKFDYIKSRKIRKYLSELKYDEDIENVCEPRYIVGANMMFKRSVFLKYGCFLENLGRVGNSLISGEETEFMIRLQKYDCKISYISDAIAEHFVDEYRTSRKYIIKRYFYQGITDFAISKYYPENQSKYKKVESSMFDTILNFAKYLGFVFAQISSIIGKNTYARDTKD